METPLKGPGVSVKRKLSIVARPKLPHSGGASSKREKPDPEVHLPTKRTATTFRTRKAGGSTMQRAVSKESTELTTGTSHENHPLLLDEDSHLMITALAKEKQELEERISDLVRSAESKKSEVESLKMEIGKLKDQKSRSETVLLEMKSLQAENQHLKEFLEEFGLNVGQAALSDNEKEFLLQKKCNSAPPSISGAPSVHPYLTSKEDVGEMETDGCEGLVVGYPGVERAFSDRGSLEWDKQSSSSISEMSVACLQDRILQMEETHYSTSEELQATLQELSDLQDQLALLQNDNEKLMYEKETLLETLYSKIQQLDESRVQIDTLKQLLLHQQQQQQSADEGEAHLTATEREQKLWDLWQCAQHEKEALINKQQELSEKLQTSRDEVADFQKDLADLSEHVKLLESTINSANADKRALERQIVEMKEQMENDKIELNRLSTLLENEKAKVLEMQQARQAKGKSEMDELLDQTRKEKDRLEARATSLQEQLSLGQCEITRLKDQLSVLQEESMVNKNNAKKHISDIEYKMQQVVEAKDNLHKQVLDLRERVLELERKCQRHLEDKKDLRSTISELQRKLNESSGQAESAQRQLDELKQKHDKEAEEWKQFQSDLLMTVRVANDFKTEAQLDVEKLLVETRQLQDRICSLEAENERLKVMKTTTSPTVHRRPLQPVGAPFSIPDPSVFSSIDGEFVQLRQPRQGRADARVSVKSIIETIENSSKPVKGQGSNGSSSAGAVARVQATSPTIIGSGPSIFETKPVVMPILRRPESDIYIKPTSRPLSSDTTTILRDQKNQVNTGMQPLRSLQRNTYSDGMGNNKSPVSSNKNSPEKQVSPSGKGSQDSDQIRPSLGIAPSPVSILTNKADQVKRPSYGDSSDKKDPLAVLAKGGGSKRNALLKWCQNKVMDYKGIDITNFSSSWNDGLAFCALLHSYLPDKIPYDTLDNKDKRRNFTLAFQAAESIGIPTLLNTNDMIAMERPDWQAIMAYVTSIYKHFELS